MPFQELHYGYRKQSEAFSKAQLDDGDVYVRTVFSLRAYLCFLVSQEIFYLSKSTHWLLIWYPSL